MGGYKVKDITEETRLLVLTLIIYIRISSHPHLNVLMVSTAPTQLKKNFDRS